MTFKKPTYLFSALGFEKLKMDSLKSDTVYLKRNNLELEEVILISDKTTPKFKPSFGSLISKKNLSLSWNYKLAVFIPYSYKTTGVLKRLKYRTSNVEGTRGLEFLPFFANIYTVDPETKLPDTPLLDNILVRKNKNKWAYVDIKRFNIQIPKNGLFLIMQILEESEYDVQFLESKYGKVSAVPSIKYHQYDKDYIRKSFIWYDHGKNFQEDFPFERWNLFKKGHFMIDFEL